MKRKLSIVYQPLGGTALLVDEISTPTENDYRLCVSEVPQMGEEIIKIYDTTISAKIAPIVVASYPRIEGTLGISDKTIKDIESHKGGCSFYCVMEEPEVDFQPEYESRKNIESLINNGRLQYPVDSDEFILGDVVEEILEPMLNKSMVIHTFIVTIKEERISYGDCSTTTYYEDIYVPLYQTKDKSWYCNKREISFREAELLLKQTLA